jgi:hypothetical protein
MITPDQIFSLCGNLAIPGWLCLLSTPLWPKRYREHLPRLIGAIVIPAIIAAIYTGVIFAHWAGHPGGFNSLSAVMLLFTDRWLVVAGWVHYLAFDLFIGGWELADSRRRGIPHLAMLPILLITFFFGPIGFLLYLALRSIFRKRPLAIAQCV